MRMGSYYGNLICVPRGKVGVDEDKDIGECSGQRECGGKMRPRMGICVENDSKQ